MQVELAVHAHLEMLLEIPEQAQLAVEVELQREEEVQAAKARREADAAAHRSLGLLARLRAAWRGE